MNQPAKAGPTVGHLLGSLAAETATLVKQEVRLASKEMGQKAQLAALDVGMIATGGALAHAGLLAVVFAIVVGLGGVLPMWQSALIIGFVGLATGYALVRKGLAALRGLDPVPEKTLETLGQSKVWMKEQLR